MRQLSVFLSVSSALAEFDADFELLNNTSEIRYQKKGQINEFLTLITACKSFPPIKLFEVNFLQFFSTEFYKCVLEFNFTSISALGGSVFLKKSQIVNPHTDLHLGSLNFFVGSTFDL